MTSRGGQAQTPGPRRSSSASYTHLGPRLGNGHWCPIHVDRATIRPDERHRPILQGAPGPAIRPSGPLVSSLLICLRRFKCVSDRHGLWGFPGHLKASHPRIRASGRGYRRRDGNSDSDSGITTTTGVSFRNEDYTGSMSEIECERPENKSCTKGKQSRQGWTKIQTTTTLLEAPSQPVHTLTVCV
jgi:hypothetical protein